MEVQLLQLLTIVESIPENLTYKAGSPSHMSTYHGLMRLMEYATESIEIASFYWTLRPSDLPFHDNSTWQGESVFDTLMSAGKDRHLKIKIVQNKPDPPNKDTEELAKYGGAEVRTLDVGRLLGSGILHTKMWLIDRQHFYVGSANLDWRSLTQVKELGALITNCSCMAQDMGKLFDAYWYLGTNTSSIPSQWPPTYNTNINNNSTMKINYNGTMATTYLSSSPPPFCASGRTNDIDAIVSVIHQAEKYWPVIDDALRRTAFDRKITRIFVVPAFTEAQKKIPYGRVNHNKYMVTDKTAYIGTSNWSGDYFITTGGIGLIVNQNVTDPSQNGNVRQQLQDIFVRDWYSQYSTEIHKFNFTWPKHHSHHHDIDKLRKALKDYYEKNADELEKENKTITPQSESGSKSKRRRSTFEVATPTNNLTPQVNSEEGSNKRKRRSTFEVTPDIKPSADKQDAGSVEQGSKKKKSKPSRSAKNSQTETKKG
ncbi:hypothetical protein KUTeg_014341 [Tegillarca granosa]|uniref:PLD phosphodiesterase domain-containing protein n=1 Tax=Tegillarca granosa TaxID=220873 RepID=A0ABQ9EZT3_TEGGR|nr:hypothetical protein KUTeg_014341 [Tegillarca granosa]